MTHSVRPSSPFLPLFHPLTDEDFYLCLRVFLLTPIYNDPQGQFVLLMDSSILNDDHNFADISLKHLCLQRRRQWYPIPVLLPGKSHGRRSLVGDSPWGREDLDTTERLHLHFSLSCIGEGNGNPLQHSCLVNPRDRGAWWAAVYGVIQSQTRLK